MIRSFRSKALRLFAETGDARKLSVPNAGRVRRILNELDIAKAPAEMDLPGYRFHALKGDRKGTFAVDASPGGPVSLTVRSPRPALASGSRIRRG